MNSHYGEVRVRQSKRASTWARTKKECVGKERVGKERVGKERVGKECTKKRVHRKKSPLKKECTEKRVHRKRAANRLIEDECTGIAIAEQRVIEDL